MYAQKALDDLIDAAWQVVESDFDPEAFTTWRECARDCVGALLGPNHPHAQFFEALVATEAKTNLLAVAGILEATKEQAVTRKIPAHHRDSGPRTIAAGEKAMV
jgi:hypothetical protein